MGNGEITGVRVTVYFIIVFSFRNPGFCAALSYFIISRSTNIYI